MNVNVEITRAMTELEKTIEQLFLMSINQRGVNGYTLTEEIKRVENALAVLKNLNDQIYLERAS